PAGGGGQVHRGRDRQDAAGVEDDGPRPEDAPAVPAGGRVPGGGGGRSAGGGAGDLRRPRVREVGRQPIRWRTTGRSAWGRQRNSLAAPSRTNRAGERRGGRKSGPGWASRQPDSRPSPRSFPRPADAGMLASAS